jgi:site-specific DNA-cytosine methylase
MRYLSVCSGIEAASVAWHHLGWTPAAFSEIDPFPSAVLAHRFPDVPNLGDMSKFKEWTHEGLQGPGSIDLLVGGTPCQSFSVAGLRKGLEDPRGNLMLTYLGIADHLKPKWIVWENVSGVLSSNKGRDFGTFLGALGQLGYQYAYRVLDAQWVRTHSLPRAVPQRRRRVFVVGYLGEVNRAAEVLFKLESLRGDPPARRKTGEGFATVVAPSLTASDDPSRSPQSSEVTQQVAAVVGALACNTGPNGHDAGNFACNQSVDAGHVIPQQVASVLYAGQEVVGSLTARSGRNNGISNDDLDAKRVICMAHGQANADIAFDHSTTLTCLHEAPIAAIPEGTIGKEPAWIPCPEECGDFFCNLHQMHTADCECPPIDEWETDPYGLQDEGPAAKSVISFKRNAGNEFPSVNEPGEVCLTLQAINSTAVVIGASGKEDREASDGTCMTLKARMGTGGGNVPMVAMAFAQNQVGEVRAGEVFNTLNTNSNASGRNTPMVAIGTDCYNGAITGEVAATMGTHGSSSNSSGPTVMHEVRAVPLKEPDDLLPESPTRKSTKGWGDEGDPAFTLRTAAVPGAAIGGNPAAMQVRRLTVGECSRLQGFPDTWMELNYGDANEAHSAQVLHHLWWSVVQEKDAERIDRISLALLTPEILLTGVFCGWISWETAERYSQHPRVQIQGPSRFTPEFLLRLREAREAGCSPYQRESYRQLARELVYPLSGMPYEEAQARAHLRCSELWPEAQRAWPLRYAFVTGKKAEKLNPDGPRYKALGNSMATNCMEWIGFRIQACEEGTL